MKKRLLSLILCIAMFFSTNAMSVGASSVIKLSDTIGTGGSFTLPTKVEGETVTWTDSPSQIDTSNVGIQVYNGKLADQTPVELTLNVGEVSELINKDFNELAAGKQLKYEDGMGVNLSNTVKIAKESENSDNMVVHFPAQTGWNDCLIAPGKISSDYVFSFKLKIDENYKGNNIKVILYDSSGREVAGVSAEISNANTKEIHIRQGINDTSAYGYQASGVKFQNLVGEWIDIAMRIDADELNYFIDVNGESLYEEPLSITASAATDIKFTQAKFASRKNQTNNIYIDDVRVKEYIYPTEIPQDLSENVFYGAESERTQNVSLSMSDGSKKNFTVKYSVDMSLHGDQICQGKIDGFNQTFPVTVNVDLRTIETIDDININTYIGGDYVLPSKVTAILNDGTEREVSVIWDKEADTSEAGIFEFTGTVDGYNEAVILTLSVNRDRPVSVTPINKSIKMLESFTLPETVEALMESNATEECSVVWEDTTVRTENPGIYEFNGYIRGYTDVSVQLVLTIEEVAVTGFRDDEMTILLKEGQSLPKEVACTYENGKIGFKEVIWSPLVEDGEAFSTEGTVEGISESISAKVNIMQLPKAALADELDTAVLEYGDYKYYEGLHLMYYPFASNNSPYLRCALDPENPSNKVIKYQNTNASYPEKNRSYAKISFYDEEYKLYAKSGLIVAEADIWLPRNFTEFRFRLLSAGNAAELTNVQLLGADKEISSVKCAYPLEKWFNLRIVTDSSDTEKQSFDIYVDGVLIKKDVKWMTIPTTTNGVGKGVSTIDFANRTDEEFICYVDNLNLYAINDYLLPSMNSVNIPSKVSSNLSLPTSYRDLTQIEWTSSNESLIALDGTVTRPHYNEGNKRVTLTATYKRDLGYFVAEETKTYSVTVLKEEMDDATRVQNALNILSLAETTTEDLPLLTEYNDATITWSSSNNSVLDEQGRVFNPEVDTDVMLTANVKSGNVSESKVFTVKVLHQTTLTDIQKIRQAMKNLTVSSSTTTSLSLPTNINGVSVTWRSSNLSAMTDNGTLVSGREATTVTLTAVLTYNDERDEKNFLVSVNSDSSGGGGGGGSSSGDGSTSKPPIQETPTIDKKPIIQDDTVIATGFSDVKGYSWASDAIRTLKEKGIINGVSETEFAPADNIKREEFIAMIVRYLGLEENADFKEFEDVKKDDWFYKEINLAYQAGLVQGIGNDIIGIGDKITRQDMAVILYRCAQQFNLTADDEEIKEFSDMGIVSYYAVDAIKSLTSAGVINGYEGNINPHNMATRAETAKMVYEFINRFTK